MKLETVTGAINGTLMMPSGGQGKVPVALLIAGSGPTDRDGNTPLLPGKNNSLKLLAESLAAQGIASVRYDKRGIAGSGGMVGGEADLRFTNYIDDAAGWLKQLRKDPRFSTVTTVGHSEGSLIGMIASQDGRADAFVSVAGAGRPIAEVLTEQLERGLPAELKPEAAKILAALSQGKTVDTVSPGLFMLFRPSVQPYMISWLPLQPTGELAKLQVPVLIVQGTTDIQAAVKDADQLAAAKPAARRVMIDGMNHILKEVREASQQMASYSDPSLPLHAELAPLIGSFILGVKRK